MVFSINIDTNIFCNCFWIFLQSQRLNSRVQQDATNFDFRKRHYEMKRAKEELEYQMKTVREGVNNWYFGGHVRLVKEGSTTCPETSRKVDILTTL